MHDYSLAISGQVAELQCAAEAMNQTYEIIRNTILLIMAASFVVWLFIRSLKRSEDPARNVFKWVLTAVFFVGFLLVQRSLWKMTGRGLVGDFGPAALIAGSAAVFGIVISIIWAPAIGALVAKPLTSMFDGGDEEPEPRPFYSIARAQQKKGNYAAALAEVHKQLDKFPDDYEGTMLLAELLAENFSDLPGAELTVHGLCSQAGLPRQQIAAALNQLADWHLKLHQDREAARAALEKILMLFPDTDVALQAAQRIAHLADDRMLVGRHDRKRIPVTKGVDNLGLLHDHSHLMPTEIDPAKQAGDYVKHLVEHPLDTEAREKLALIYADYYQRLDLAADQLEQLIQQPNQPSKLVVHWLNLLADLQLKHANDLAAARQALQRIIDQYPGLAAAENAQRRLDILKLELKGKEKGQAVALGSYDQNIGLKRRA